MQGRRGVQVPGAQAKPLEGKQGRVISVDERGRSFVDRTARAYEDFRDAFPAIVAKPHPTGVYLQSDRRVPYGDVVRVLAVMREAGVADVGLVAEPEEIQR